MFVWYENEDRNNDVLAVIHRFLQALCVKCIQVPTINIL